MQHLVHIIQLLSDFVRVHFTDTPACLICVFRRTVSAQIHQTS